MGDWNQAGQGALGGAMTGAAAGSAFGPWGTAIGGAAGGLLGGAAGYFGGGGNSAYEQQLKQMAAGYGSRTAPQAGPAHTAGYSDFRGNQAGLIAQLEAMARGNGPSAARMQMQDAMDRAAGAQASAAAGAGGRGVNAGAALRTAMGNTAAVQAQGARDTATLRAQEQMAATGQLGQVIGQGRAADENTNQFNAGSMNDMDRANLEAKLRTMGMNDQAQLQALMAAMGVAGPGMGTSILAGGSNAVPGILQMVQSRQGQGAQPSAVPRSGQGYTTNEGYLNYNQPGRIGGSGGGSPTDPNNPWNWS